MKVANNEYRIHSVEPRQVNRYTLLSIAMNP